MTRISLNGSDWHIKAYYGEDWRWRDAHMPVNRDPRLWLPASVPGTIQHDLWQAGEIPDPYFERNSLLIEWIPARTWVYRRTFTLDLSLRGQRAQLRFEGVDYEARFFLNGHDLGHHVGMYTPAIFEVTDFLNFDAGNVLAVVVEPAPHEQPQVSRTSRVRTHKSRMTYWWDFCPRMVHIGIWDDVTLDFHASARITDVFVHPTLDADLQRADVSVTVDLDSAQSGAVTVDTTLRLDADSITATRAEHTLAPGSTRLDLTLAVDQPRLWYPNGYGDQPLYEADIRALAADGTLLDRRTVRFGIRSIGLIPNETPDASARPYTLVVNGQRLYIKGWNWVPMDVMYGVPRPEKLERLLTLAQRAHVNLLRIWGGGLIETEAFYNRCDELGILVWQEFIMSSSGIDNNPSTEPEFIAMMVDEAEQIIPRRRNHPSLAIWCGGNELTAGEEQPLDDRHPLLAALRDTVARLDPDRLWLPTSPIGRLFSNSLENIESDPTGLHDVHGPWEYQGVTGQYELYNQGTSLLHSEFGVEGITNLSTLDTVIAPDNQFPVTLDNPIWEHLGAWWVKAAMWRETFGDISDIERLVRATQLTQADGLRYALEADRRRKYQNSGTLPWQFNEPYPMAACTSAVDYYGQPKPVYYAVAHAYEPVHVSARFETSAWAGRDTFTAQVWASSSLLHIIDDVTLTIRVLDVRGRACHESAAVITLNPDSAAIIATVDLPLASITTDVFFLDLALAHTGGRLLSRNRYSFTQAANLAPLLSVPETRLEVDLKRADHADTLTITNIGDHTALFVWLEDARAAGTAGFVYFANNHLCLMPQETRTIGARWSGVSQVKRRITARGWNTDTWQG